MQKNKCNIDNAGRRKGQETLKARRDATPDVGFSSRRGNEEFAKRMEAAGGRRFDEPGMVVRIKK